MMTALGIIIALFATAAGLLWLTRRVDEQKREGAVDHLAAAQDLLESDNRPGALAAAGEAFWASPSGIYHPEEAAVARAVLQVVHDTLGDSAEPLRKQLRTIMAEFEDACDGGGAIAPEMLDPVAEFLHDVADDTFLAHELLRKADSGDLNLVLLPGD